MRRRNGLIALAALALLAAAGATALLWPEPEHRAAAPPPPPARPPAPLSPRWCPSIPTARPAPLEHRLPHLGVVAPDWARVREDGYFDYTTLEQSTRDLQARGARLLPVVHDPAGAIDEVLADPGRANRLALRLAAGLKTVHADGVVLDVDDVPPRAGRPTPSSCARCASCSARRRRSSSPCRPPPPWAGRRATTCATSPAPRSCSSTRTASTAPTRSPVPWRRWSGSARSCAPRCTPPRASAWCSASRPGAIAGSRTAYSASRRRRRTPLTELAREAEDGAELQLDGAATWVETDRSVELKLKVARAAKVAGIALELGGGESTHLWEAPLVGLEPAA